MRKENDEGIRQITELAIKDVQNAVSQKINRPLTSDESDAIAMLIDTELFWARAEELRMFVKLRSESEVLAGMENLAAHYREGTLIVNRPAAEPTKRVIRCDMCNASGVCYCIRKGSGTAVGCPRCGGTEKCRHCNGTGTR